MPMYVDRCVSPVPQQVALWLVGSYPGRDVTLSAQKGQKKPFIFFEVAGGGGGGNPTGGSICLVWFFQPPKRHAKRHAKRSTKTACKTEHQNRMPARNAYSNLAVGAAKTMAEVEVFGGHVCADQPSRAQEGR
jgi:hypothetical protein